MPKRENFLPAFLIFFVLSLIIFKFCDTPIIRNFTFLGEKVIAPLSKISLDLFNSPKNFFKNNEIEKLKEENRTLLLKTINQTELQKENNALKDQFKTTYPKSQNLMPAKIVGRPDQNLVLDKGSKDNVIVGQAVVFENNLIGKISFVSQSLSKVLLASDSNSSFSVKISQTNILGVVKGTGDGEMIMGNVLLSENLKISDTVLTTGDLDVNGLGYPADLVVGKVESIDKKSASLFQSARIKSLIEISKLSTVFIITSF